MHTSGTSGEIGYFLYAPADFGRLRAAAMRNRKAFRAVFPKFGLRLRRKSNNIYGAARGHLDRAAAVATMLNGNDRRFLDARCFLENISTPALLQKINQ